VIPAGPPPGDGEISAGRSLPGSDLSAAIRSGSRPASSGCCGCSGTGGLDVGCGPLQSGCPVGTVGIAGTDRRSSISSPRSIVVRAELTQQLDPLANLLSPLHDKTVQRPSSVTSRAQVGHDSHMAGDGEMVWG